MEGRDPVEDFKAINEELKKYSEKLAKRKQIIVANKVDVTQDESLYNKLEELAKKENLEIFRISAATGEGIKDLIKRVEEVLKEIPKEDLIEVEERVEYTLEDKKDEFTIRKEKDEFIVEGPAVERLMKRVNMYDNESSYYFQKRLREIGVEAKLKEMGVKEGDVVMIDGYELEWYD